MAILRRRWMGMDYEVGRARPDTGSGNRMLGFPLSHLRERVPKAGEGASAQRTQELLQIRYGSGDTLTPTPLPEGERRDYLAETVGAGGREGEKPAIIPGQPPHPGFWRRLPMSLTAIIDTARGVITVELLADKAPLTVANFVNLARRGFYDGLNFHRVIADFIWSRRPRLPV